MVSGQLGHQTVEFGYVWSHAYEVWQRNMGLLVGAVLVVAGISFGCSFGIQMIQLSLLKAGQREVAMFGGVALSLLSNVVQIYLGIGQAQMAIKLARSQRADFSDLFNGGGRVMEIIGFSILAGIGLTLGFLLLIIPGIILLFMYWPTYYLIVDSKASVMDSFEKASNITSNNHGTTFVIWLVSIGVMILGILACGIGMLFAAPLISMMWVTAYLMMSGQIPMQRQQFPYPSPYPQMGPQGYPQSYGPTGQAAPSFPPIGPSSTPPGKV